MKLNLKEIQMFKGLYDTDLGRGLISYFEHLKTELFSPDVVTKENFEARKEAFNLIQEHFVDRLRLVNKGSEAKKNEFV